MTAPEPPRIRDEVEVVARKPDGRPSYRFRSRIVEDAGDRVAVAIPRGTEVDSARHGPYCTTTDAVLHLWRDRWFNVVVHRDEDGRPSLYYCNVAMPPEITRDRISFVDLELDLFVRNDLSFETLDREEFEAADLTGDVRRRALAAAAALRTMIEERRFPFGPR